MVRDSNAYHKDCESNLDKGSRLGVMGYGGGSGELGTVAPSNA